MTLNSQFASPIPARSYRAFEGPERLLDILVGLIIVIVNILVGFLLVYALLVIAVETDTDSSAAGFFLAALGSGIPVIITTLIYIVRITRGRRSWTAPLTGLVLIAIANIVGFSIAATGA